MCPQVSCSPGVLGQECWDLRSPQTTLPGFHTHVSAQDIFQVVCTISEWPRRWAPPELPWAAALLWGDHIMTSRDRGRPASQSSCAQCSHLWPGWFFISSFDPKVLRRNNFPIWGEQFGFPVVQPSLVMSGFAVFQSKRSFSTMSLPAWLVSFQVCTHSSIVPEIRIMVCLW